SEFIEQHSIKQLAKGDTISVLDIVQRHCSVLFGLGSRGTRDLSVYVKINIEGTRAVFDAAVTAGIHRLIYTSSTGVVINGTNVLNVNEQVPFLEKSFNVYNDAQEMFGPGDHQIEDGSYRAYHHCQAHIQISDNRGRLVPPASYSSTTSSEPRLDPEGAAAKLNKSLHCALPPICATTKYHHSAQTLSPYVTPTLNTESILSVFNTP
ncbi:hypothetical protein BKA82DRAFT_3952468, partial [Pisolithus tinctorius]